MRAAATGAVPPAHRCRLRGQHREAGRGPHRPHRPAAIHGAGPGHAAGRRGRLRVRPRPVRRPTAATGVCGATRTAPTNARRYTHTHTHNTAHMAHGTTPHGGARGGLKQTVARWPKQQKRRGAPAAPPPSAAAGSHVGARPDDDPKPLTTRPELPPAPPVDAARTGVVMARSSVRPRASALSAVRLRKCPVGLRLRRSVGDGPRPADPYSRTLPSITLPCSLKPPRWLWPSSPPAPLSTLEPDAGTAQSRSRGEGRPRCPRPSDVYSCPAPPPPPPPPAPLRPPPLWPCRAPDLEPTTKGDTGCQLDTSPRRSTALRTDALLTATGEGYEPPPPLAPYPSRSSRLGWGGGPAPLPFPRPCGRQ